jgi:ATP-dependent helicase/nuclease subunit A
VTPGAIRLISASAGSGKTYRLVEELEKAITRDHGAVRPEAVVATTFTVKAAAELRERVRSRLLEAGRVEAAQRLGAARIGTVNSVCAQLVGDFAFELGLSPEVQVLDETAAESAFNRALSFVVSAAGGDRDAAGAGAPSAGASLVALAGRWPRFDWASDVRQVAQRARENGLGAEEVRACGARSAKTFLAYFGPVGADGRAVERALEQALAAFLNGPIDETGVTKKVVEVARQAHTRLVSGRPLAWGEWAKLATRAPAVRSRAAYEPVRAAARGHERHPGPSRDVAQCIEGVFELAAQALEQYDGYKREWGLMDFVDQEVRALGLLRNPDVQAMLREQVDLVLVDEFQDTSPLQLAIFLALAGIAPQSVWVGDQKQAIYGFRGTDPALMDAAIEAIVAASGAEAHDTLRHSWRSRAELVRLTSDLFAPAFEAHGIPPERVRLEPAADTPDPDAMGPIVEGWELSTRNKDDDAEALAEAVRALLADEGVTVRDAASDTTRTVQPRDVAVLCRSNENCTLVTRALERAGIRVVRARLGLMTTPEALIVRAALRLWVEPRQPLASAELGRLLVHADAADRWLQEVVDAPGAAYTTLPEVERLAVASGRQPLAGPLTAFDEAIEAAGVREACLRWGRSGQRLANLDALRALAHRYVARCAAEGEAATVAGLLAQFEKLASDREDEQATVSRDNAVTVSTLHGAKGLEWPVTVLHKIDSSREASAFGVHVATDREAFDFSDPLGGRWVRYWPDPYVSESGYSYADGTAVGQRVAGGREHADADRRQTREALRLLYVGWTRARDLLVLAGRPGEIVGDTLKLLADKAGTPLIGEPAEACTWAGRAVTARIRKAMPAEGRPQPATPGSGYDAAGPRDFPPSSADMSSLAVPGRLGHAEVLASAPHVQLPVEPVELGHAVHAFYAGDRPGLDAAERLSMATASLCRWSVQGALRPEELVASSDALRGWIARRWPSARWHREWPLRLRAENGTELAGYADLVLMDADCFVLVDHKCPVGTREEAMAGAAKYAGQLGAYATAMAAATGRRAAGCFLHLVTQGVVVPIES